MIRGSFSHQLKAYIRQGYAPPEAMRLSWIDVRAGKVSPPPRPGRARGPRRLSRKSVALMRRESNPYYAVVDRGGGPGELPLLGGVNRYESWPYSRRGDAERRALDFARANLDAGRKVGRVRVVYKRRDPMRRAPLTAQDVGLVRKYYPREEFGNAPWRGVELYNRVLEIRAQKGNTGRYPRRRFFHRFKHRARMFGLPNGDLLITGR